MSEVKFEVGDLVRCVNTCRKIELTVGREYIVKMAGGYNNCFIRIFNDPTLVDGRFKSERFERVESTMYEKHGTWMPDSGLKDNAQKVKEKRLQDCVGASPAADKPVRSNEATAGNGEIYFEGKRAIYKSAFASVRRQRYENLMRFEESADLVCKLQEQLLEERKAFKLYRDCDAEHKKKVLEELNTLKGYLEKMKTFIDEEG